MSNDGEAPDAPKTKLRAQLESLSPKELDDLRSWAWDRLMRARKAPNLDGKTVTLKALKDQAVQERQEFERGMYDEDVRTIPRWQAQEMIPSSRLRPGAYKQALREDEEDALELQRMGCGVVFKPRKILSSLIPARHSAAYGIFARPDRVEQLLRSAWAGREPEAVLLDSAFYHDVLRRCHQVEMTLMLLASRPLALSEVRPAVQERLQQGMQRLAGVDELRQEDQADLHQFVLLFDDRRLARCGWVERGHVKEGTHLIFTTTPKGGITAEAITPGPLRDRKTSFIGKAQNPLITGAVFDAFLGPQPVDSLGKRQVGAGFLWAANGFSFKPGQHPDQHMGYVDKDGEVKFAAPQGVVERLPKTTTIFHLLDGGLEPVRMLLNRVAGGSSTRDSTGRATVVAE